MPIRITPSRLSAKTVDHRLKQPAISTSMENLAKRGFFRHHVYALRRLPWHQDHRQNNRFVQRGKLLQSHLIYRTLGPLIYVAIGAVISKYILHSCGTLCCPPRTWRRCASRPTHGPAEWCPLLDLSDAFSTILTLTTHQSL